MTYYLKKNWRIVSVTSFIKVIAELIYTLLQLILMQSFEAAIQKDFKGFLYWIIVNIVGYVCYFLIAACGCAMEARTKRKLNNQVRHDIYLSMLSKNHKELTDRDTGEYMSWLSTNIKMIQQLAWEPFFNCVGQVSLIIWCVIALLSLHWLMLAAGVFSAIIMLVLPKLFMPKMEKLGKACVDAEAGGLSKMKDLLSGFEVLRSLGRVERMVDFGDKVSDEIEEPVYDRECTQSYISCATGFASIFLQLFQQIITVILAFRGEIILGAIASASNFTAGITNGLRSVADNRMSMAAAKPYFDHISVHEESALNSEKESILTPLEHDIKLQNVSFQYGDTTILQELSLQFNKGGKYALTGPSGCGKSTILKLLLGWFTEYSGRILFDGKDVKNYSAQQIQMQMSYIEQDVFLFNTTIRDNITLGSAFSEDQIQKAVKDSALDGDLVYMPLGLDTPVGEDGNCLSGGQKQRVAIARALIHHRSILLVDEGTSALDQKNAEIVEQSLLANPDLTLILVSHHLSEERKAQFTKVYDLKKITVNS